MLKRAIPVLALAALAACIPKDTRPEPGQLFVTFTASDATTRGPLSTDDGYDVTFDRYLISIRHDRIGDQCSLYYEPGYGRVLSLLLPGVQKLNYFYGLGTCDFRYALDAPQEDSLAGVGVTQGDIDLFRTPGTDPYVPAGGTSVEVQGRATSGDVTTTFHWFFRATVRYMDCSLPGADPHQEVSITAQSSPTFDLLAHGDTLFRDSLLETAKLRFAAIAAADRMHGDGNGDVTLDELSQTPIAEARASGDYAIDPAVADTLSLPPTGIATLLDFVYYAQLPRIMRYRDTGGCKVRPPRGD